MTTTKAGTKGVPRADREELILAAATRHFAEHGYAATTLADVAADAGITKPLVYSYFGPKEELFAACVAHAAANLQGFTSATPGTGVDAVLAIVRTTLSALEQRPYDWTLVYGIEVPKGTAAAETLREHRRRLIAPAVEQVREVARGAGLRNKDDIALLTDLWLGMLTSLVRWWHAHPDTTVDEVLARCARLYHALLTMIEETS
jgi:AcrR family transcriptional regulator